jgi:tripartite-type tricarboxylate transporter receptor subunit TctC
VRNIPGADGITAMNYFVQQVAPDGLTMAMGSYTQSDPLHYRNPNSKYDPTKFRMVGGVGLGGTTLIIRKDATARLRDSKAEPIVMGSIGGIPRFGNRATAWGIEFLGWNAKWVVGYRGTNDLLLALERGEIDMASTANTFLITKMTGTGKFAILTQTGSQENGKFVGRPEFGDAPVLASLMKDALNDPTVKKAFDYWTSLTSIDKWIALPETTPEPIVATYRQAFMRATKSKEFIESARKMSEDLEPMNYETVELFLKTLGSAEPETINYSNTLLRKQGLKVE